LVVGLAARVLLSVIRQCRPLLKIDFSKDPPEEKIKAVACTAYRNGQRGKDIAVLLAIVLDCQDDIPEWHRHPGRRQASNKLSAGEKNLGRKKRLTWASHIEACTKKAKQLAVAMTSCVRAKWGLGRRVVQQIYKGAVEPIMLNGVAAWAAALTKRGAQRRLRSVQRLAALAMTGCFRTTSTTAALALAGLLPAEMAAGKVLVQQYCHGPMSRRLEIIRTPCKWSPHLWHVRQLLQSAGIRLDWSFERRVQNHEMGYPPHRVEAGVIPANNRESA